jgi:integrase/recombinase XerD
VASIHRCKRSGGRVVWELTHGRPPNRVRFVVGESRAEAEAALSLFKRTLSEHGAAPERLSIREAIERYRDFLSANRSPATARRYLRILETFERCFLGALHPEVVLLKDVKAQHIEEYKEKRRLGRIAESPERLAEIAERKRALRQEMAEGGIERPEKGALGALGSRPLKEKVSPRTVHYEIEALRTFFRFAVKRNYLLQSPMGNVEGLHLPKRSLPKFMTAEELSLFFAACNAEERRIFTILFLSGMRRGELEHLEWSDVRFDLGLLMIQEKADWRPKTDERVIPLSDALREALLEARRERRSEQWVVSTRSGGRETHLLEKVKSICRRAGIAPRAATVHALRHSFGAHLRMAGVPLANIADLMGHRDLATTQIYAKVEVEHLRAAISHLGPLLPARDVSLKCVSGARSETKALPKPSKQETYALVLRNGGEGGIRTLGPGLPRTTA